MWDEVLFFIPFQNCSRVRCTQVGDSGPLGLLFIHLDVMLIFHLKKKTFIVQCLKRLRTVNITAIFE